MRDFEDIENTGLIDTAYKGESILKIRKSDLIKCEFLRCSLHDISESTFFGSKLADCDARNLRAKSNDLSYLEVEDTDLSLSFLHHSTASESLFCKVNFQSTIFKYGEITTTKFLNCDFSKSVFNGITFKDVDFSDSFFEKSAFRDCTFLSCDFSKIIAMKNVYLANCDLVECEMPDEDEFSIEITSFFLDEQNQSDEVICYNIIPHSADAKSDFGITNTAEV